MISSDVRHLLAQLLDAASGVDLQLTGLSEHATTALLESILGEAPEAQFVTASHRATGGNPFLITELAQSLADQRIEPRAHHMAMIDEVAPRSIIQSVETRLRRLAPRARALAQAAATFGLEAELRHTAALAGMNVEDAATAADALIGARLLSAASPLRFEHSVIRSAVLAGVAPAQLAQNHQRAAELLATDGAPADRVANHLLVSPRLGDPESVRWLTEAGDAVLRRGAPETALAYYERALAEPPPPEERWPVLRRLGNAEGLLGRPSAAEHLRDALRGCPDPQLRPVLAIELSDALAQPGHMKDAFDVLTAAIAEQPGDPDMVHYLEAALLSHALTDNNLTRLVRPRVEHLIGLPGDTPAERTVLAVATYVKANDGSPRDVVLELARRAVGPGRLLPESQPSVEWRVYGLLSRTLATFGDIEGARRIHSWVFAEADAKGSVETYTIGLVAEAALAYTIGDVRAAAEDAETAIAVSIESGAGFSVALWLATAMMAAASVEIGRTTDALDTLRRAGLLEPVPDLGIFDLALYFRALVRVASGDEKSALDDLFELARREAVAGHHYAFAQWRVAAAPLLAATGRRPDAQELLEEELEVCRRRGASRPLGAALRVFGTIEGGEAGLVALRESVDVLDESPFRLELAKSEVELGAALRRHGRRADARPHLERGLDLAFRCRATELTARARDEQLAAGARPRRLVVSGPDALTTSERRVAELAAAGRSNPEIAQALFVSRKTVETHLSRAYQKLEITSRAQLRDALGTDS